MCVGGFLVGGRGGRKGLDMKKGSWISGDGSDGFPFKL